jgi:hypothetical protein
MLYQAEPQPDVLLFLGTARLASLSGMQERSFKKSELGSVPSAIVNFGSARSPYQKQLLRKRTFLKRVLENSHSGLRVAIVPTL